MAESKVEQAYTRLRQDILQAHLLPSMPLPVSILKERYDLGWTPIREALSRLEQERLVNFAQNRGYRVAGVSREELLDLQKARMAVESSLLEESIGMGDAEWEQRIVAAHYLFRRTKPLYAQMPEPELALWEERHHAFHKALLSGTTSLWLSRFADQISMHLHRHQRAMVHAGIFDGKREKEAGRITDILVRASSLEHHEALMEATLARDTERAVALLREHIGFSLAAFQEMSEDDRHD